LEDAGDVKLGFEESQTPFNSGSQQARVWTERWVGDWMFCPNCGAARLSQFPANSPVADFYCPACSDQFEVKSKNAKTFGNRVADGAYFTKIDRLKSKTNPNLLLLGYSKASKEVRNVVVVPKHFFVPEIIQKRKPLAATARRAGWVGSNILLNLVPDSGRIVVLRDGVPEPKEGVLAKWQQTLFLRSTSIEARGWLIEVMKAVEAIRQPEFELNDVYAFEPQLSALYPDNNNVRPKIRQQLQVLRDNGYLEFLGGGRYRLRAGGM
jgi:type II restriction enzyme